MLVGVIGSSVGITPPVLDSSVCLCFPSMSCYGIFWELSGQVQVRNVPNSQMFNVQSQNVLYGGHPAQCSRRKMSELLPVLLLVSLLFCRSLDPKLLPRWLMPGLSYSHTRTSLTFNSPVSHSTSESFRKGSCALPVNKLLRKCSLVRIPISRNRVNCIFTLYLE